MQFRSDCNQGYQTIIQKLVYSPEKVSIDFLRNLIYIRLVLVWSGLRAKLLPQSNIIQHVNTKKRHQLLCKINHMTLVHSHEPHTLSTWWRHQMVTFFALLAICAGNSPVPGEFPTQRPVTRSFDVFFDLRPNKRLRKQSWGWWFETPSRPLSRHRNASFNLCCIRKVR